MALGLKTSDVTHFKSHYHPKNIKTILVIYSPNINNTSISPFSHSPHWYETTAKKERERKKDTTKPLTFSAKKSGKKPLTRRKVYKPARALSRLGQTSCREISLRCLTQGTKWCACKGLFSISGGLGDIIHCFLNLCLIAMLV